MLASIAHAAPVCSQMPIESIIHQASNGRMFILVDDDEGSAASLVIPAQMATPAAVNFMATHARGLICLALTRERVGELGLPLMGDASGPSDRDVYTVSIEARDGVSTGISAADRSRTVMAAIGYSTGQDEIVSPGHVFPVVAQTGGVLVRAGHVEAAVDIARLAGLNPSAVVCRILGNDGSTASMAELVRLAEHHDLSIATVRDLIAYRRRHDNLVERCSDKEFAMPSGSIWRAITYRSLVDDTRQVALVKGSLDGPAATLVRMHALSLFDDVLDCLGPRRDLLDRSIDAIEEAGRGVIVLMRSQNFGVPAEDSNEESGEQDADIRSYGFGAQLLSDLNIQNIVLLTHAHINIVAIKGWGISITEQRMI
jgi:3,4-dihydroxy 2-butanone 4-phosphate synthase/GTP cyclohydrolase II